MAETAYVLIKCGFGREDGIIKEMREKFPDTIKEVMGVYGAYDIVAKFYCKNSEDLKDISWGMRKIEGIESTLKMIVTDSYKKSN